MHMHNQVHEAARQIIENASDIHGALALAGRHDLVGKIVSIQKKAACIVKMERPHVDPTESCRQDMMNAIGSLGHVINRNLDEWPVFNGDEIVTIIRLAEQCVRRGHAWLDMVVRAELENADHMSNKQGDTDECA